MRGSQLFGLILEPDFDFIPWKLTDTRPRDRCSRAQSLHQVQIILGFVSFRFVSFRFGSSFTSAVSFCLYLSTRF